MLVHGQACQMFVHLHLTKIAKFYTLTRCHLYRVGLSSQVFSPLNFKLNTL